MEKIARKNKDNEMQMKMELEERERKIQDLEVENRMLKQQLEESRVKTGEDEAAPEKVWYYFCSHVFQSKSWAEWLNCNNIFVAGKQVNHIWRNSINYSITWKE